MHDESILRRARGLARCVYEARPAASLPWTWRSAILLFGTVELARVTGDAELFEHVAKFVHNPRHARVRIARSDAAACALPALALYEATGDRAGLALAERAAEYLQNAPTSREGAVFHLGTEPWARPLPASVWADSLMMVGPFLARWAVLRSDADARRRILEMTFAFARHLKDPETGLFHHAHVPTFDLALPGRGAFWTRGNGWMLAAAASIAETLVLDRAEQTRFDHAFLPAARKVAECMQSDGALPALIRLGGANRGIEASGTALCSAGMIALGSLRGHDGARAAASCIRELPDGRFVLRNVSGPTNAGPAFSYAFVPEAVNADYGVGAMLLLAAAKLTSSRAALRSPASSAA